MSSKRKHLQTSSSNGTRPKQPRGKTPVIPTSTLPPASIDEAYGHSPGSIDKFQPECSDKLLQKNGGIFVAKQGSLVLYRHHHGKKEVRCNIEDMLLLMDEIVNSLRLYGMAERKWLWLEHGEHYAALKDIADRIHPAGSTFYKYSTSVKPVRKTRDLRELAMELRMLAEENKIDWTPQERWKAFLDARRRLVGRLYVAFELFTKPKNNQFPGLPAYGKATAIYKWIAQVLLVFDIRKKKPNTKGYWKTLRQDRESPAYQQKYLPLENSYRGHLNNTFPLRLERIRFFLNSKISQRSS